MEHLLLKLAAQLDAMDEASLMSLWEKYAGIVSQFEPSRRWQEAALVLSLIQAKRWKNQLFNVQWAARTRAGHSGETAPDLPPPAFTLERPAGAEKDAPSSGRRATVLAFHPRRNED